jgi:anaerobic ribonucleoside-triphosphate reductase
MTDMKHTVTLSDAERQPCEIWTRVMGYHRPVSSFNTGKKGEFHERTCFTEASLATQAQAH